MAGAHDQWGSLGGAVECVANGRTHCVFLCRQVWASLSRILMYCRYVPIQQTFAPPPIADYDTTLSVLLGTMKKIFNVYSGLMFFLVDEIRQLDAL